jgi:hypothetical protein
VEAARLLERSLTAIQQLPDDPSSRRLEFEVHLALVPVLMAISMAGGRTREVARRAIALCEEFGAMERALPALFAEASYYSSSGDFEAALRLASRIISIGSDIHDDATLLAGHRFVGSERLRAGALAPDVARSSAQARRKICRASCGPRFGKASCAPRRASGDARPARSGLRRLYRGLGKP